MAWTTAGNLASRADSLRATYPGITIYTIGDSSHTVSDHNPDGRQIVHALDAMTYDDLGRGAEILSWCLADPTDLEYIIFDKKIYARDYGFVAATYHGSDPHTDHVHISGKHGDVGYSAATGTGYDTTAEAYRPAGLEDDVSAQEVWMWDVDASAPGAMSASHALWLTVNRCGWLANEWAPSTSTTLAGMVDDISQLQTEVANGQLQAEQAARAGRRLAVLLVVLILITMAGAAGALAFAGR